MVNMWDIVLIGGAAYFYISNKAQIDAWLQVHLGGQTPVGANIPGSTLTQTPRGDPTYVAPPSKNTGPRAKPPSKQERSRPTRQLPIPKGPAQPVQFQQPTNNPDPMQNETSQELPDNTPAPGPRPIATTQQRPSRNQGGTTAPIPQTMPQTQSAAPAPIQGAPQTPATVTDPSLGPLGGILGGRTPPVETPTPPPVDNVPTTPTPHSADPLGSIATPSTSPSPAADPCAGLIGQPSTYDACRKAHGLPPAAGAVYVDEFGDPVIDYPYYSDYYDDYDEVGVEDIYPLLPGYPYLYSSGITIA